MQVLLALKHTKPTKPDAMFTDCKRWKAWCGYCSWSQSWWRFWEMVWTRTWQHSRTPCQRSAVRHFIICLCSCKNRKGKKPQRTQRAAMSLTLLHIYLHVLSTDWQLWICHGMSRDRFTAFQLTCSNSSSDTLCNCMCTHG